MLLLPLVIGAVLDIISPFINALLIIWRYFEKIIAGSSSPAANIRYFERDTSTAPDPRKICWETDKPNAKLCISLVLNVEEGGERCILNGDMSSENRLCDLADPSIFGKRNLPIEQLYEYGSRVGFTRLSNMLIQRNLPVTVYAVGKCLELNPKICEDLKYFISHHGWEVASHGLRWIDYSECMDENEHVVLDQKIQERLLNNRPLGYYAGKPSLETIDIVASYGYNYINDIYNDDVPYWVKTTNNNNNSSSNIDPTILLAIPYSVVNNDMRCVTTIGVHSADLLVDEIINGIDYMIEECESENKSKMMSIGLHPRIAGQPIRAPAFSRLFDRLEKLVLNGDIVVQTRKKISDNMYLNHYPKAK